MGSPDKEPISCRSYTHARRHPLVLGKIGDWRPPPLSLTQWAVLLGSFLGLLYSLGLWAHLPGPANLVVCVALPVFLAWTVRHLRMEGRSPVQMAVGLGAYLSSARRGVYHGRPVREGRAEVWRRERIFCSSPDADDDRHSGNAAPLALATSLVRPGRRRSRRAG